MFNNMRDKAAETTVLKRKYGDDFDNGLKRLKIMVTTEQLLARIHQLPRHLQYHIYRLYEQRFIRERTIRQHHFKMYQENKRAAWNRLCTNIRDYIEDTVSQIESNMDDALEDLEQDDEWEPMDPNLRYSLLINTAFETIGGIAQHLERRFEEPICRCRMPSSLRSCDSCFFAGLDQRYED